MKEVHIHKYMRVNIGRVSPYYVMKCMHIDCTHFIPAALALGRSCQCWRCGDTFVMSIADVQFKKPHCKKCTRKNTKVEEVVA